MAGCDATMVRATHLSVNKTFWSVGLWLGIAIRLNCEGPPRSSTVRLIEQRSANR